MVAEAGKPALSQRLREMGFMKRREERTLRANLAAAADAAAAEARWVTRSSDERDAASDSAAYVSPIVVVEGGTDVGGGSAARAGRRSFGSFNTVVERDFETYATNSEAKAVNTPSSEAADSLAEAAAEQYQRWKSAHVSRGRIRGLSFNMNVSETTRNPAQNSAKIDGVARTIEKKLHLNRKRRRKTNGSQHGEASAVHADEGEHDGEDEVEHESFDDTMDASSRNAFGDSRKHGSEHSDNRNIARDACQEPSPDRAISAPHSATHGGTQNCTSEIRSKHVRPFKRPKF